MMINSFHVYNIHTYFVNVNNKNIKIGDYLISSDFPGFSELQMTETENLNKLINGVWTDETSTPRLITWQAEIQYNFSLAKAGQDITWEVGEQ